MASYRKRSIPTTAATVVEQPSTSKYSKKSLTDFYHLHFNDQTLQAVLYRDQVLIQLRTMENGRFTTKGIALNEAEWEGFMSLWSEIDREFSEKCPRGERIWALGERKRTVSIKKFDKDLVYLDIRNRFLDPQGDGMQMKYSKSGCCLNENAYNIVKKCAPLIQEDIETLHGELDIKTSDLTDNMRMIDERLRRLDSVTKETPYSHNALYSDESL